MQLATCNLRSFRSVYPGKRHFSPSFGVLIFAAIHKIFAAARKIFAAIHIFIDFFKNVKPKI